MRDCYKIIRIIYYLYLYQLLNTFWDKFDSDNMIAVFNAYNMKFTKLESQDRI